MADLINVPGLAALTGGETRALDLLADAWNEYLALGEDPVWQSEFRFHLHALQQQVMARVAIRLHPTYFNARNEVSRG